MFEGVAKLLEVGLPSVLALIGGVLIYSAIWRSGDFSEVRQGASFALGAFLMVLAIGLFIWWVSRWQSVLAPAPTPAAGISPSPVSTSTIAPAGTPSLQSPVAPAAESSAPATQGPALPTPTVADSASQTGTPTRSPTPPPSSWPSLPDCDITFPRAPDKDAVWRYVVRNGDTLKSIFQAFLPYMDDPVGSWQVIHAANEWVIGERVAGSDRIPLLHSGQVLGIPGVSSPIHYQVLGDEYLTTIAARFYGKLHDNDEPLWCRIYVDNRDSIGFDPDRLNPGQMLNLYPLEMIELPRYAVRPGDNLTILGEAFFNSPTMYHTLCTNMFEGVEAECRELFPHEVLELIPPPSGWPYIVQPSDALQSISRDCYGTTAKAWQIHAANRMVLGDDASHLRQGQRITLYACSLIPTPSPGP